MIPQRSDLTFKHNIKQGRHGWLRLTPAYSVKIVQEALERVGKPQFVLDPFSGTGTTGLVCAERGIPCDLAELNPFLVWLAEAKTHHYTTAELDAACDLARAAATEARQNHRADNLWIPPLNHIERWWLSERLIALASLFNRLQNRRGYVGENPAVKLAMIAFCRAAINWSNAAFNHQSMSFREAQPTLLRQDERDLILDDFLACIQQIAASARLPLAGGVTVHEGDSRCINTLSPRLYDCVLGLKYFTLLAILSFTIPWCRWSKFT